MNNNRILEIDNVLVRFKSKDYWDNKTKTMQLACMEFFSRLMQHVYLEYRDSPQLVLQNAVFWDHGFCQRCASF
ncbi:MULTISPECIES: transposase [Rhodonellum]|uniref:transposase n=1 Tax=Rhodonellum TaxID=336827 RepID=UPI00349E9947